MDGEEGPPNLFVLSLRRSGLLFQHLLQLLKLLLGPTKLRQLGVKWWDRNDQLPREATLLMNPQKHVPGWSPLVHRSPKCQCSRMLSKSPPLRFLANLPASLTNWRKMLQILIISLGKQGRDWRLLRELRPRQLKRRLLLSMQG